LEEAILKLKHCFELSKCKVEPNHDLKINDKSKGKFPQKRGIPTDASEKENLIPYKIVNTINKGRGE